MSTQRKLAISVGVAWLLAIGSAVFAQPATQISRSDVLTAAAPAICTSLVVGRPSMTVDISNISGTVTFQARGASLRTYQVTNTASGLAVTTTTGNGLFRFDNPGLQAACLTVAGATGTINVIWTTGATSGGGAGGSGGGGGGAVTAADGALASIGTTTDASVTGDNDGTVLSKLRYQNKVWASIWDSVNGVVKVGTHAVSQSGTWTFQPGNTANTTAWLVTGTGGVFPATQSGSWTVGSNQGTAAAQANRWPVCLSDGANCLALSSDATTATTTQTSGPQIFSNSRTSLPTAVASGNSVADMADPFGRRINYPVAPRELIGAAAPITLTNTTETTLIAAAASQFSDVITIVCNNTSATNVRADVRDATAGSVIFPIYVPANDVRGVAFPAPWPQTTANNNWTVQLSASVTDVRCWAEYVKNK